MPANSQAGFREVEHTADWALEVWAPAIGELIRQAALGLEALRGVRLTPGKPPQPLEIRLDAPDAETALVEFLNEVLFLRDTQGMWFRPQKVVWARGEVRAVGQAFPLAGVDKEVKAATYHNLRIERTTEGWRATVVVDV